MLKERRVYFKDTEDNIIEFYTLDMKKDYKERIKLWFAPFYKWLPIMLIMLTRNKPLSGYGYF